MQKSQRRKFQTKNLSVSFGGLKAVQSFSLALEPNSLVGLIGPNGAGKTTVFNLITGVFPPDSGEMSLDDQSLLGQDACKISVAGIARTFQNIRVFKHLSVLENVLVAMHQLKGYRLWDAIFRNAKFYEVEAQSRKKAMELLQIMGLQSRAHESARNLSYGDQRRLEIARALATQPALLLLDEPAAGLNTQEKAELMRTVAKVREHFGVSILLIDHDMKLVMGICERILVLDHGETIAEGTPQEIQKNPRVIEAYLGVA